MRIFRHPALPCPPPRFPDLVGIPYVEGGRSVAGADCWGLGVLAFRAIGITLPGYEALANGAAGLCAAVDGETSQWLQVEPSREQAFDGVLLWYGRRLHVGWIVRRGEMLDTRRGAGSRIESNCHFLNRLASQSGLSHAPITDL